MVSIVKDNLNAIKDLCKRYNVASLYIFGSAARENDFSEKSDVDFLVTFKHFPTGNDEEVFFKVKNYDDLHENLQSVIKRKVDLIQEENIKNKFLKYFINKEKKLLYGVS